MQSYSKLIDYGCPSLAHRKNQISTSKKVRLKVSISLKFQISIKFHILPHKNNTLKYKKVRLTHIQYYFINIIFFYFQSLYLHFILLPLCCLRPLLTWVSRIV